MSKRGADRVWVTVLCRSAAAFGLVVTLAACSTPSPETELPWPAGRTYIVHEGDTLSGVAARYRVSEAELARYNGLRSPGHIFAGEELYIPPVHNAAATYREEPHSTLRRDEPRATPQPRPDMRVARVERYEEPRATPQPRPAYHAPYRQPAVAPSRAPEEPAPDAPRFQWPVSGKVLATFGSISNGGRNDGINIAAEADAPIRAAAAGTVIYAGNELKNYGNLVLIRHADGYVTAYAHAKDIVVDRNAEVRAGQVIGHAGQSGGVSAPQLHFEIRRGTHPVDPEPLLSGKAAG